MRKPLSERPKPPPELDDALADITAFLEEIRLCDEFALTLFGVTAAQLQVLCLLLDSDDESINQLAKRAATHQSSVSAVVRYLAKHDLVTKHAKPGDRRAVRVRLTAKGRALARRAQVGRPLLALALSALPKASLKTLSRLLGKLTTRMDEIRTSIPK